MSVERFKKVEDLFHAASAIPAAKRSDFLKKECGSDIGLFEEVNTLLSNASKPNSLIDLGVAELAASLIEETNIDIVGRRIGRYRVERLIGEGGMGNVYLAKDPKLARPVALKILSLEMSMRDERIKRFMHEARAASALNHPNILTIYEIDEFLDPETEKAVHFISMEFIEGKTLQEVIHYEARPVAELLRIIRQVSEGLAKAHDAGIIHRDLKPENLMVTHDGFAKILDFGLAKLTNAENELHALQEHQSRPGVILGTLGYMSPEQVRGDLNIDHRSDIFSLGCILYETLTKQKAFEGENTVDSLHAIMHGDPVPMSEILPGISPDISSFVGKCLDKDRLGRFQDIRQVVRELRTLEKGVLTGRARESGEREQRTKFLDGPPTQPTVSRQFSKQRKQLTVLYADIGGISDALDDLDPEMATGVMDQLWAGIDEAISRFEGRIDQRLTDRFIAFFGVEQSHESDPESAVRAALEVDSLIDRFVTERLSEHLTDKYANGKFENPFFRAGITTGTVIVGGTGESTESLISGPTVNRAKKLLRRTDAGRLLISHDTYRHVRGVFQVESAGEQDGPLYSVTGVKPRAFRIRTRGVEGIETKMVGRESELSQLLDALHISLEDRELQRVSVVGEAGLGKSRLLYEFQDQADLLRDKFFVFRARGIESKKSVPFGFLRELFFFRFGIFETETADSARDRFVEGIIELTADSTVAFAEPSDQEMQAHFLGQLIGLDFSTSEHIKGILDDPEQIQERAFNYTSRFFQSVAEIEPVLLLLDDLQWADSGSLRLLDYLAREAAGSPIMLAEFMRPSFFDANPLWGEGTSNRSRVDLKSLSKRQSRGLVADILQKVPDIPLELRDRIVENGAGNPLYIEELIKMFIEQRIVLLEDEHWTVDEERLGETPIPATLTGLIQSRLDRLSQPERAVLQRASVIGLEFWDEAVSHLNPGVNVRTVLESLRSKELLFQRQESVIGQTNEYVFKYVLLRDVTYESVLISDRSEWHEKTAEWLVSLRDERENEFATTIAAHFKMGGNWKQSAKWFAVSGEQAQRAYAPNQVIRCMEESRTLWFKQSGDVKETHETIGWWDMLVRAYWNQGDFDTAGKAAEGMLAAAESLGDLRWQTKALTEISVCRFEKGDTANAFTASEKSVEIGRRAGKDGASRLALADALFRYGRVIATMGKTEETERAAEESLEIANELGDAGRKQAGLAYHLIGLVKMRVGDLTAAKELFEKDLEIARRIGNRRIEANELNSLGEIMRLSGNGPEALSYFNRALLICKETNNYSSQIMISSNIGGARVLTGEYELAEKELSELVDTVGDHGHFLISESHIFLTQSLIGQGKLKEAHRTALKALELASEADNKETIAAAWHVLGVIASLQGGIVIVNNKKMKAEVCFEKSRKLFASQETEDAVAQVLYDLSGNYSESGNSEKASEIAKKAASVADRLGIDIVSRSAYVTAGKEKYRE